jgi:hypothetical protein
MMIPNLAQPDPSLVADMRLRAARMTYDGRNSPAARRYIDHCTRYHHPTRTCLIYTRDAGMHASGWWKNPDYDRCLHLSVSFIAMEPGSFTRLPQDHKMAAKWCKIFFGEEVSKLWIEPPFSEQGKESDVYHYRLFCDPVWRPLIPRGEVYSKDWTPAGWKSWSDLHGEKDGDGNFGSPNAITTPEA